jgi:nucleotide-binding universal stress UspA family protein
MSRTTLHKFARDRDEDAAARGMEGDEDSEDDCESNADPVAREAHSVSIIRRWNSLGLKSLSSANERTPLSASTRTILVPLDGSDLAQQALPFAQAVATLHDELVLLRVVQQRESAVPPHGRQRECHPDPSDAEVQLRNAAARSLDSTFRARTRFVIDVGESADAIVQRARVESASLVVMASHGRGGVRRWGLGSVADRVARTASSPVMIVRAHDTNKPPAFEEFRRVIVPLDGSELAEEAVPVATDVAQHLHIPVLALSVVPAPDSWPQLVFEPSLATEEYRQRLDDHVATMRSTLGAATNALRKAGVLCESRIVEGLPVEELLAAAVVGDLIVLTSHGRSGVRRWVLGSVAERLVREGPVPVVIVPNADRIAQLPHVTQQESQRASFAESDQVPAE